MPNGGERTAASADDHRAIASAGLLLLLLLCLVYLPALEHGFFVDDDVYVGARNRILPNLEAGDLWRLLVQRGNAWEFLPVRDFTYWIDLRLFDGDPWGFHLANLLWYLLCCLAVFLFVGEALLLYSDWDRQHIRAAAALAVAVFFIHPAHVEAVAWVSGRKDILATCFSALAGAAFISGIRQGWRASRLWLAGFFLVLAFFSKSVAVFFAAPLALCAIGARRRPGAATGVAFRAYLLVPLALAAVALYVHLRVGAETGIGIVSQPGAMAAVDRASRILADLTGILFAPFEPRLIYDVYRLGAWHWGLSAAIAACVLAAVAALAAGRRSLPAFGIVATFLPLLPYLQFSSFVTWSLASERFVFQASAGLALLLAHGFASVRPRLALAGALCLILAFSGVSAVRVLQWESPLSLRLNELRINGGHHSTVREYVLGHALPGRNFSAARARADGLADPLARDLLLRLIDAREGLARDIAAGAAARRDYPEFCAVARTLDDDLIRLRRKSDYPDVSFLNYFGHLRGFLNRQVDVAKFCRPPAAPAVTGR